MSGFPTKPTRTSFGPTYVNRYPVREPNKEIGDTIANQLFWQVAGLGVVSPIAIAQIVFDGAGAGTLGFSAEAWDSDGGSVPTLVDVGTGIFRLEYSATVNDETGAAIALAFHSAKAYGLSTSTANGLIHAQCEIDATGYKVTSRIYDGSAATPSLFDPTSRSVIVEIY